MGWAQAHVPIVEVPVSTLRDLDAAVTEWQRHRSTGNEEKLTAALAALKARA